MSWEIIQTDEYSSWFLEQDEFTQLKVRQAIEELKLKGPMLGRPRADTLHGSNVVKNLKELRVDIIHNRPCRIFFAFTPDRAGLLLCAGVKDGAGAKNFYKKYIRMAEDLFREYTEE